MYDSDRHFQALFDQTPAEFAFSAATTAEVEEWQSRFRPRLRKALGLDVMENAVAAAFRDPRFMPLTRAEFDEIRVEVSLLSPAEAMVVASEEHALVSLRPGIDGVVFEYGHYRSTFLPQVWEQLPEPAEFLAHLKRKAGLPVDFWADQVRLSRYTVSKWKESGPHEQ